MNDQTRFRDVAAVSFAFEPAPWAWAEAHAERIDRHWASLAAANPALFDGHVLVLRRGEFVGDAFRGAYLETRYSRFIAWRDFGFPDPSLRNCFAMAALRARDGGFLLGVMGPHTSNPGKIYFAAGTPDREDIVDGAVDVAGSAVRELVEETGLDPAALDVEDRWTVVEHGPRIALMRRVRADATAAELRERIHANLAAQEQPELAGMVIVRDLDDIAAHEAAMPPFVAAYLRRELALQPCG